MSLADDLRTLPPELRLTGGAAAALAATLILPWYEKSFVPRGASAFVTQDVSAFGVFSFVEAAVLLVAAGVLYLVWARAKQRAFHLPGGDGAVVTLAGGWALLLLVWRMFDKPQAGGDAATVGLQWGIFVALAAAAALAAAGARVRAADRPEPPNPAEDVGWEGRPIRRTPDAGPRPRERPAVPDWEGDPPEPPAAQRPPR